jgi:hypothetical protein
MYKRIISIFSLILVLCLAGVSSADLVAYWDFEGDFLDAVGGNDATAQGDAAIVIDSDRGNVADFDGSGDYLEIPNSPSLNITGDQITLTSWVYHNNAPGTYEIVLAKIFQDGQHVAPYFAYNLCKLAGGAPRFFLVISGREYRLPGTPNFESGRWYHMAGTYDGSEMILYVDGEVSATMDAMGNIDGYDKPLFIGINGGRTEPMDGRIDDVRIYNHALDQTEIQAVMMQVGGGYPYAMALDPKDGDIHEDTWVTMSWRPGDFAVSHDVYLGENLNDVNEATQDSELFRGNQTDTFIIAGFLGYPYPDGLVPGMTYYWRIDEVNNAEPNSPWKGDVWSFMVPPKTAYSPIPADGAELIPVNATFIWTAGLGAKVHYIYFGEDFDTVNNTTNGASVGITSYNPGQLEPAKTYYWRVDESDGFETYKGQVWSFTTVGTASNPAPPNGAVDVKATSILSWNAGSVAASHEVYFGTDANAVTNATKDSPEYKGPKALGEEIYDPGRLALNTTYYWRIEEVNNLNTDSPWPGVLWNFTTGGFLVIDDFEDYDAGDNQVWFAWHDGLGYGVLGTDPYYAGNGTGSAIGDETGWSPMELSIVHGGQQSVPFFYDNNKQGYAYYSEVEHTLTDQRDWTEEGVTELSLWFYGYSANDPEPFYVAISNRNGAPAIVIHDDANAATIETWTEWVIPLSAFVDQGIILTDVDRIAIGLGTKSNMTLPGGSGKMYFDDIRLYQPRGY